VKTDIELAPLILVISAASLIGWALVKVINRDPKKPAKKPTRGEMQRGLGWYVALISFAWGVWTWFTFDITVDLPRGGAVINLALHSERLVRLGAAAVGLVVGVILAVTAGRANEERQMMKDEG